MEIMQATPTVTVYPDGAIHRAYPNGVREVEIGRDVLVFDAGWLIPTRAYVKWECKRERVSAIGRTYNYA